MEVSWVVLLKICALGCHEKVTIAQKKRPKDDATTRA